MTFPSSSRRASIRSKDRRVLLFEEKGTAIDKFKFSRKLKGGEDVHAVAGYDAAAMEAAERL